MPKATALFTVFMAFADHFDTNWLVRASSPKAAERAVRRAAETDKHVLSELDRYGYNVKRPSCCIADPALEGDDDWKDLYGDIDEAAVTETPILYDSGT